MTTIFSKEIEILEKGCGRFIDYRADNFNDLFRCSENNLCPTCKEKLSTLKQAEQKHLKFVEELKKEFDYTYWAEFDYDDCLILETNFKQKIDNISKGDELK